MTSNLSNIRAFFNLAVSQLNFTFFQKVISMFMLTCLRCWEWRWSSFLPNLLSPMSSAGRTSLTRTVVQFTCTVHLYSSPLLQRFSLWNKSHVGCVCYVSVVLTIRKIFDNSVCLAVARAGWLVELQTKTWYRQRLNGPQQHPLKTFLVFTKWKMDR